MHWLMTTRTESGRYFPDWRLGSEGDHGEHLRDPDAGWPYSIFLQAAETGVSDAVLCHGIQNRADAVALLALLESSRKEHAANVATSAA
jgi:hypothetical protein